MTPLVCRICGACGACGGWLNRLRLLHRYPTNNAPPPPAPTKASLTTSSCMTRGSSTRRVFARWTRPGYPSWVVRSCPRCTPSAPPCTSWPTPSPPAGSTCASASRKMSSAMLRQVPSCFSGYRALPLWPVCDGFVGSAAEAFLAQLAIHDLCLAIAWGH